MFLDQQGEGMRRERERERESPEEEKVIIPGKERKRRGRFVRSIELEKVFSQDSMI